MINIEDFDKVEMRAGTVIDVKDNKGNFPCHFSNGVPSTAFVGARFNMNAAVSRA